LLFGLIDIFLELWVVSVVIGFQPYILLVLLFGELVDQFAIEVRSRPVFHQALFLLIEDGQVNLLVTQLGQLHRLFNEASLPLAIGHVS